MNRLQQTLKKLHHSKLARLEWDSQTRQCNIDVTEIPIKTYQFI